MVAAVAAIQLLYCTMERLLMDYFGKNETLTSGAKVTVYVKLHSLDTSFLARPVLSRKAKVTHHYSL